MNNRRKHMPITRGEMEELKAMLADGGGDKIESLKLRVADSEAKPKKWDRVKSFMKRKVF